MAFTITYEKLGKYKKDPKNKPSHVERNAQNSGLVMYDERQPPRGAMTLLLGLGHLPPLYKILPQAWSIFITEYAVFSFLMCVIWLLLVIYFYYMADLFFFLPLTSAGS